MRIPKYYQNNQHQIQGQKFLYWHVTFFNVLKCVILWAAIVSCSNAWTIPTISTSIRYTPAYVPITTTTTTTTTTSHSQQRSTTFCKNSAFRLFMAGSYSKSNTGNKKQRQQKRQRRRISLDNGREATLLSRSLDITSDWSITVWEWENPAQVVESYWESHGQRQKLKDQENHQIYDYEDLSSSSSSSVLLDPFGLVSWPGSVVAAQELQKHSKRIVQNATVLILGAGVGVEAQASAMLGARQVIATDIHPTTLLQLELGVRENPLIPTTNTAAIENGTNSSSTTTTTSSTDSSNHNTGSSRKRRSIVTTQLLDVFKEEEYPLPPDFDLLVVADVLYNEELATQIGIRIAQACQQNPKLRVLVTDSQRFVDFPNILNHQLKECFDQTSLSTIASRVQVTEKAFEFTGSGVCIDEDQTYDVTVRTLWIGLDDE